MSIFDYPWRVLVEGASTGDLFTCHIAFEAVALVDPDDLLPKLRATFRFKPDYADEIGRATDLGWFLVRHGDALDPSAVARRTVWCVRTILIARAAEEGKPVFSPDLLADRTASKAARHLLRNRHAGRADHAMRTRLRAFLREHAPHDGFHREADVGEFLDRFEATGNDTALRTASMMRKADQPYG